MLVTSALLILFTSLLVALLIRRRWHFSYFEKLGIPGPKPNIIWGNLREYHSMELYKVLGKWHQQYGDIFGFFNGDVPFVVVNDLKLIEEIYVRNFQNFVDRGLTMMTDQMHPFLKKSIIHICGSPWKNIRTAVACGFTARKLKLESVKPSTARTVPAVGNPSRRRGGICYRFTPMMPHIEENADIFIKYMGKYADSGKEVHMLHKFEELSMDYVARGAFGIDERFQGKPDHPALAVAKATLRGCMIGPFHMIAHCTTTFGALMKPLHWLSLCLGEYSFQNLTDQTAKIVELRKQDPSLRKPDILQNLLDAEYVETEQDGNDTSLSNVSLKYRALTTEEIVTSASTLFVAGFETTAAALSYTVYLLAKHPEVQERLRQEIADAVAYNEGFLNYEVVMKKAKYLAQVVDEALRLFPPGLTFMTRRAKEDFVYDDIRFKAGTCFMVSQYQMQRSPNSWTDPSEFIPDRFSGDHHPVLRHMPFGVGPRNCVGMRLALLNIRYTVARILQKYRLELGPSQKGTMEMGQYAMVSTPARGPWIVLHSLDNGCITK